jgi:hypothetical protein
MTSGIDEKVRSFRGNSQIEAESRAREWVSSQPNIKVVRSVSTRMTEAAGTLEATEMWHTHVHYSENSN